MKQRVRQSCSSLKPGSINTLSVSCPTSNPQTGLASSALEANPNPVCLFWKLPVGAPSTPCSPGWALSLLPVTRSPCSCRIYTCHPLGPSSGPFLLWPGHCCPLWPTMAPATLALCQPSFLPLGTVSSTQACRQYCEGQREREPYEWEHAWKRKDVRAEGYRKAKREEDKGENRRGSMWLDLEPRWAVETQEARVAFKRELYT